MIPGLAAAVVAGVLIGMACALALAAATPRHPVLGDALAALDESTPPPPRQDARIAARYRLLLPGLRRLPLSVAPGDLDLLGIARDRFLIEAALSAAACGASGPFLATVFAVLATGIPITVPSGVTVVGLVVGWTSHARRVQVRADDARTELRSALVSYLQQVGLLRKGGSGVSTALTLPTRLLADSWAMRRLRDELDLAQHSGEMPWEGLRRFGERVAIDELTDLSSIAATAGHDGGTVVGTLLARAESLRDELLADEHAAANRASGQMSTPGALQVFLIAAWVLFPAAITLFNGT